MGIATILAVLAFFIAMLALWLTSDIVKKVESQNDKFIRAHVASLREELRDMDSLLHKASRSVKSHGEGQVEIDKRLSVQEQMLQDVQIQFSLLTAKLDELDRSIPQRYRVRTVKSESKNTASKPSLQ